MERAKVELNNPFCLVAVLGIIKNVFNIFSAVIHLLMPESLEFDGSTIMISSHPASIFTIVFSLLLIVSLILALSKKKIGIYGFAVVVFLFHMLSLAFYEDILSQLPVNLFVVILQYTLFFGLLMIKHDGVRSWNVFFPKKGTKSINDIVEGQEPDNNVKSNHTEFANCANKASANTASPKIHSMPLSAECHDMISTDTNGASAEKEKPSASSNTEEEINENVTSRMKQKKIPTEIYIIVLMVCIVLAGLCGGVFWFYKTSQPENPYTLAQNSRFSLSYPSDYRPVDIQNAPHMCLKLENNSYQFTASYWNKGYDESVSIWDDEMYEACNSLPIDGELLAVDKVKVSTKNGKMRSVRVMSTLNAEYSTINSVSYLMIQDGYLFLFAFYSDKTIFEPADLEYQEKFLKGLFFQHYGEDAFDDSYDYLMESVKSLNAQCPFYADEVTTIRSVVLSGKTVCIRLEASNEILESIDYSILESTFCENFSKTLPEKFFVYLEEYGYSLKYLIYDETNKLHKVLNISPMDVMEYYT